MSLNLFPFREWMKSFLNELWLEAARKIGYPMNKFDFFFKFWNAYLKEWYIKLIYWN